MADEGIVNAEITETDGANNSRFDTVVQSYQPFDPEIEITKVLHSQTELPTLITDVIDVNDPQAKSVLREEKEARLGVFKREFINQKLAIAHLNLSLYEVLMDNPEASIEELLALVDKYSLEGRFPLSYKEKYAKGLKIRAQKYNFAKAYLGYGEDAAEVAFQDVCDSSPEGEVELQLSSVGAHLIMYNKEDVRKVFYYDEPVPPLRSALRARQDYFLSMRVAGFQSRGYTFENCAWKEHSQDESQRIAQHEIMHTFNGMFDLVSTSQVEWAEEWSNADTKISEKFEQLHRNGVLTVETARPLLVAYVEHLSKAEREKHNHRVRDEILAFSTNYNKVSSDWDSIGRTIKSGYLTKYRSFIYKPDDLASDHDKEDHATFYNRIDSKLDKVFRNVEDKQDTHLTEIRKNFLGKLVKDTEFQKVIRSVFEGQWEKQIDRFLGYARDIEIAVEASGQNISLTTAILYTEPINKWRRISQALSEN